MRCHVSFLTHPVAASDPEKRLIDDDPEVPITSATLAGVNLETCFVARGEFYSGI